MPLLPPTRQSWQPLASLGQEAHIDFILEDIAAELWNRRDELDPTMFSGLAGAALFLGHLSRRPGWEAQAARAEQLMELAISRLEEAPGLHLYQGFPGLSWCVEHLRHLHVIAGEVDPNAEVDEWIGDVLATEEWQGSYDLFGGLVGLGLYALERQPNPTSRALLVRVVDHIEALAVSRGSGIVWPTRVESLPEWERERCPHGYLNFGVAHGIPGVLGLLASIRSQGIEPDRCARLIHQGLNGLQDFLQSPEDGAALPAWCPWEKDRPEPTFSRLAWCNGEFGASWLLWQAANSVDREDWQEIALSIARAAAMRPRDTSGVKDVGLCHGSAGNLHLFNRWYQATGEVVFREAALAYLDMTLDFHDPSRGFAGFWSCALVNEDHALDYDPAPGLLEGAAGAGLALLSCSEDSNPSWDRFLLLSGGAD
jgi:lantibiotic modifying enzyme